MIEQAELLSWTFYGFIGFITLCLSVIGYYTKRIIEDVRELQRESTACRLEHEKHRTHVSEFYAKKEDVAVGRTEMNETLRRLHERIDNLPEKIISLLRREG